MLAGAGTQERSTQPRTPMALGAALDPALAAAAVAYAEGDVNLQPLHNMTSLLWAFTSDRCLGHRVRVSSMVSVGQGMIGS